MNWLRQVGERLIDFIPVERWVQSVSNVIRYLGLAFILLFLLVLAVLLDDWGLSSTQRFSLIILLLVLMLAALVIALMLAAKGGDLLYSPYDRSLRQGRRFGTEASPLRKTEAEKLPSEPMKPMLPPPKSKEETTK